MHTQKHGKEIIRGSFVYALGNLGTKIIAFLIVPLYTFYIQPDALGDYDIIITTISLLTPLITLRISDAAYRWMLRDEGKAYKYVSSTYAVILIGTILSCFVILLINQLIPIQYCYYFAGILFCGRWMESLQILLRGLKKQKLFVVTGLVYTILYILLNILFIVVMKRGVEALFQSMIISQVCTSLLCLFLTPELRVVPKIDANNKSLIKEMLHYSVPLVPSGLSWWVMSASDRYVVRFFISRDATGILTAASKFPSIFSSLFVVFNFAWTDVALSRLKEGEETSKYSSDLFRRLIRFSFSFLYVLIPLTKLAANFILGSEYVSAGIYTGFLYMGALFQGYTTFISAGVLQGTETKSVAVSSMIGAISNLVIDLLLIRGIGLHAASLSTCIGFFVMWVVRMRDVKKRSPIIFNKISFSIYFFFGLLVSFVTIFTDKFVDAGLSIIAFSFFLVMNHNEVMALVRRMKGS